jgi:hypothetical protein
LTPCLAPCAPRVDGEGPQWLQQAFACILTRLKLIGAFSDNVNVRQVTILDWDSLYARDRDRDPIEAKIANAGRQDQAPPRSPTPALPHGLILLPAPSKNGHSHDSPSVTQGRPRPGLGLRHPPWPLCRSRLLRMTGN